MDLLIFSVFLAVALAFFALGKLFKAFWFIAGGGVLFIVLGVAGLSNGLHYQVVNATSSNFTFSSDYFEYANDTVQCHNCTDDWVFNNTWNATPPSCCAHDVNTTIAGSIAQANVYDFETRELDLETSLVISLALALFGLGSVLDVSLTMLRQSKGDKKADEEDDA